MYMLKLHRLLLLKKKNSSRNANNDSSEDDSTEARVLNKIFSAPSILNTTTSSTSTPTAAATATTTRTTSTASSSNSAPSSQSVVQAQTSQQSEHKDEKNESVVVAPAPPPRLSKSSMSSPSLLASSSSTTTTPKTPQTPKSPKSPNALPSYKPILLSDRRIETGDTLSIDEDFIILEGRLLLRPKLAFSSWKSTYYIIDGPCLWRVKEKPAAVAATVAVDTVASEGGGKYPVVTADPDPEKNRNRSFLILDKLWIGFGSEPASTIVRAVDGEPICGKKCTIGLFFAQARAPLMLRAENIEVQQLWIQRLTELIQKNRDEGYLSHQESNDDLDSNYDEDAPAITIHNAVHAMHDAAVITDAYGIVQCVNSAFAQLTGYLASDLLGADVKALMPEGLAKKHDGWMDHFRKSGEKKKIGVPRMLPVVIRGGLIKSILISLGEIPGSLNSDKNRFIAILRTKEEEQQEKKVKRRKTARASQEVAEQEHEQQGPNDASSVKSHQIVHTMIQKGIAGVQQGLDIVTNDCLNYYDSQMKYLEERIADLEARNAKLLAVTSRQTYAIDHLVESISDCTVYDSTNDSELTSLRSAVMSASEHLFLPSDSVDITEMNSGPLPPSLTMDQVREMRERMTSQQRLMYNVITDEGTASLDTILKLPIAFKHFILFSYQERAEENCKFFIYMSTHYERETHLEVLLQKKDFIMENFVRIGSQFELNLESKIRRNIESVYQTDVARGKGWIRQLSPEDYEKHLFREHAFFNTVLASCKECLLDTLMRFRRHEKYELMKSELFCQLCDELVFANKQQA